MQSARSSWQGSTPYGVGVPTQPTQPTQPTPQTPQLRPAPLSVAVLGIQVLVIMGFSVFYVVELALGLGEDRARVAMSILVFLVGAAGLAMLARAFSRGASWPRTPSLVWHALLIPLAVSLAQAGQVLLGIGVGVIAAAGIAGVVFSRRR